MFGDKKTNRDTSHGTLFIAFRNVDNPTNSEIQNIMADAEQTDKTTPTPQRRPYHQNKPNYSHRGRGRPDPHVSKALHNFGVSDLREWLDKKHQQEGQSNRGGGPPPDPSYSYLKDPLRENTHSDEHGGRYKEHHERPSYAPSRGTGSRGFRGRRGGFNSDDRRQEAEKFSYIQNPINIKVELTTATGERNYELDEETKLADIKHVPDRKQQERRSFRDDRERGGQDSYRGRGQGGRGRGDPGRGRGDFVRGRGDSWRGRGELGRGRGDFTIGRGESWRGRGEISRGVGERGRGGRGRGFRGFRQGRGQGRYNSDRNRNQEQVLPTIPSTEVPTDENWDDECVQTPSQIAPPASTGNIVEENENLDEVNPEDYYEEAEDLHGDYEGGDEYSEVAEGYEDYSVTDESHPVEESESVGAAALEENLVITSSVAEKHEEGGKRTVRFAFDDKPRELIEKQTDAEEKPETTRNESDEKLVKENEDQEKPETVKSESDEKLVKVNEDREKPETVKSEPDGKLVKEPEDASKCKSHEKDNSETLKETTAEKKDNNVD